MRGLRAVAVAVSCVLAGCTMPPATQDKDADTAAAPAASGKRLQPLGRGLAVPPGAAPRSAVPSVRYDLAVSGTGESLDDGVPGDEPREIFERGGASWYGIQFHQRKTANGERFDMGAMTAAHKTLPFNTRVCVRSLVNGSEVLVRVNDRGPFTPGRIIDLSRAAADRIGLTSMGIKQVALSVIDREGMRCGGQAVAAEDLQPALLPEAPTSRVRAPAPARKRVIVPPRKRR